MNNSNFTIKELFNFIESNNSINKNNKLILEQIEKIKFKWSTYSNLSNSQIKQDLILILYCQTQYTLSSRNSTALDLEFVLPIAIKLAGGGKKDTTLSDRRLGYQACTQLFTLKPHPLKLLLINTIRNDLQTHPDSPQAELKWLLGLKALNSNTLLSQDLIPVVQDRAMELYKSQNTSLAVKRLAFGALLSIVNYGKEMDYNIESILEQLQSFLHSSLSSPTSFNTSSSSTTSSHPSLISLTIQAFKKGSPIYPNSREIKIQVLHLYLNILERLTKGEWKSKKWLHNGISCGWLGVKLLEGIRDLLEDISDIPDELNQKIILSSVLDYLATIINSPPSNFVNGIILASLQLIQTIPYSTYVNLPLSTNQSKTISLLLLKLLAYIKPSRLSNTNSTEANNLQFTMKCLTLIPCELWTGESQTEAKIVEKTGWDENVWKRIMSFLDVDLEVKLGEEVVEEEGDKKVLRKLTLKVLKKVDENILELYMNRLLGLLRGIVSGSSSGEQRRNIRQENRIISLLLEASNILDLSAKNWLIRLETILQIVEKEEKEVVVDILVLQTIDRFNLLENDSQLKIQFVELLFKNGNWKNNLSFGLIFAATVGAGVTSSNNLDYIAQEMIKWLMNEDDSTLPYLLDSLSSPFLLSLLRISSILPLPQATTLYTKIQLLEPKHSQNNSNSPTIFDHFNKVFSNEIEIKNFRKVGKESKVDKNGLLIFLEKLENSFKNNNLELDLDLDNLSLNQSINNTASVTSSKHQEREEGIKNWEAKRERKALGGKGWEGEGMVQSLMLPSDSALGLKNENQELVDYSDEDVEDGELEKQEKNEVDQEDLLVDVAVDPFL